MRYVEVTTPKLLASRCGSRDASWCSAIERALGQGSGGADRRHPADGRASRKAVLRAGRRITGLLYGVTALQCGHAHMKAPQGWKRPFDDPIPLPRGRQLVT